MARSTLIEDVFAAYLAALPDVVTLTGGKVYPFAHAPQGDAGPYLTYQRVSYSPTQSLRGPTCKLSWARIQVDAIARDYDAAKLLADAVCVAVNGLGGSGPFDMGGKTVSAVIVLDSHDAAADPLHGDESTEPRIITDVKIWFNEGG